MTTFAIPAGGRMPAGGAEWSGAHAVLVAEVDRLASQVRAMGPARAAPAVAALRDFASMLADMGSERDPGRRGLPALTATGLVDLCRVLSSDLAAGDGPRAGIEDISHARAWTVELRQALDRREL